MSTSREAMLLWTAELARMQAWTNITDAVLYGDGGGCGVEDGDIFDVVTDCWTVRCLLTGLQITSPVFNFQYQRCQRTITNNNNNK